MKKIVFLQEEKKESEELEFKDIVRGEYENKIRTFSSIEKKFLIFSKAKTNEEPKMNYYQFLETVVPFQYMKVLKEESIFEILNKNTLFQNLLKKVDVNNDGFINFEEFVIWALILSLQMDDLKNKFPKGKLSKEDFCEYLMKNMENLNVLKITDKAFIDARMIKSDRDTIFRTLVDFCTKCFKDTIISIDKEIENLIVDLSLIMLIYEVNKIY